MPPSSSDSVLNLTVRCLCGSHIHSFPIRASDLPIPIHPCHCRICRHITGAFAVTFAGVPFPLPAPSNSDSDADNNEQLKDKDALRHFPDLSKLTAFATCDSNTRYFCPTCGSHLYGIQPPSLASLPAPNRQSGWGDVNVCSGALSLPHKPQPPLVKTKCHIFLSSVTGPCGDDSITPFARHPYGGEALKRWRAFPDASAEVPLVDGNLAARPAAERPGTLLAHCHCQRVRFAISAPAPGARLPARLCACVDCRVSVGTEPVGWCEVPARCIRDISEGGQGKTLEEGVFEGMGVYESEEGTRRSFCRGCGAKMTMERAGKKGVVEVAVGVLGYRAGVEGGGKGESGVFAGEDGGDGGEEVEGDAVRAEDWLEWKIGVVDGKGEAMDGELIGGMEREMEAWARENNTA